MRCVFWCLPAILTGFGRVVGEVGVSMMLGGKIRWFTRTKTTAIALETSKGDFELGLGSWIDFDCCSGIVNYVFIFYVMERNGACLNHFSRGFICG